MPDAKKTTRSSAVTEAFGQIAGGLGFLHSLGSQEQFIEVLGVLIAGSATSFFDDDQEARLDDIIDQARKAFTKMASQPGNPMTLQ